MRAGTASLAAGPMRPSDFTALLRTAASLSFKASISPLTAAIVSASVSARARGWAAPRAAASPHTQTQRAWLMPPRPLRLAPLFRRRRGGFAYFLPNIIQVLLDAVQPFFHLGGGLRLQLRRLRPAVAAGSDAPAEITDTAAVRPAFQLVQLVLGFPQIAVRFIQLVGLLIDFIGQAFHFLARLANVFLGSLGLLRRLPVLGLFVVGLAAGVERQENPDAQAEQDQSSAVP